MTKKIFKMLCMILILCSLISCVKYENFTMNLTLNNFSVPTANQTEYICKMFNITEHLPKNLTGQDLYVIGFEGILKTKNIHHILILGCEEDVKFDPSTATCTFMMNPKCFTVIGGWVMGHKKVILPDQAGIDWGRGNSKIVMMQIHYNNPQRESMVDSSGLKILYTNNQNIKPSGIMFIMKKNNQIKLPPGRKNITINETCPESCLQKMPSSGIKIFGAILHGHKLLRKIRLVIKNQNNIDQNTFRDDHYNFQMQYVKFLQKPITLTPQSSIELICEYDSTARNRLTAGGPSTNDEMCAALLFYYPKKNGPSICSTSFGCVYNSSSNMTNFTSPHN